MTARRDGVEHPARGVFPRVALLDWGVGGLLVRAELARVRPDVRVAYFADSGVEPYGRQSRAALVARLNAVLGWLRGKGASRVVLACNAASSALTSLADAPLPVEGMLDDGVSAVLAAGVAKVTVLGGERTVRSGYHRRVLAERGVRAQGRVAQPLSAAIERGEADAPATHALVRRLVAGLPADATILLACTHYPAAMPALRDALPRATFLDPAASLVQRLAASLEADPGDDVVFTSGDPDSTRRAAASVGVRADPIYSALTPNRSK